MSDLWFSIVTGIIIGFIAFVFCALALIARTVVGIHIELVGIRAALATKKEIYLRDIRDLLEPQFFQRLKIKKQEHPE